MSALLTAFGIDWRLLLINSINFGLLLLALWYFLYGPLMRMLDARREKIAQGVRDADEARRAREEIEASRGVLLADAGREADAVLAAARTAALAKEREAAAASEAAALRVRQDAEREAAEQKRQALEESKQEIAKLIVLGIEKAHTR